MGSLAYLPEAEWLNIIVGIRGTIVGAYQLAITIGTLIYTFLC